MQKKKEGKGIREGVTTPLRARDSSAPVKKKGGSGGQFQPKKIQKKLVMPRRRSPGKAGSRGKGGKREGEGAGRCGRLRR